MQMGQKTTTLTIPLKTTPPSLAWTLILHPVTEIGTTLLIHADSTDLPPQNPTLTQKFYPQSKRHPKTTGSPKKTIITNL